MFIKYGVYIFIVLYLYISFLPLSQAFDLPEEHESIFQVVCGLQTESVGDRIRTYMSKMDWYLINLRAQNPMIYEYTHISKNFTESNSGDLKAMCSYVLVSRKKREDYAEDCSDMIQDMSQEEFICETGRTTFWTASNLTESNNFYDKRARCLYQMALNQKLDLVIEELVDERYLKHACLSVVKANSKLE